MKNYSFLNNAFRFILFVSISYGFQILQSSTKVISNNAVIKIRIKDRPQDIVIVSFEFNTLIILGFHYDIIHNDHYDVIRNVRPISVIYLKLRANQSWCPFESEEKLPQNLYITSIKYFDTTRNEEKSIKFIPVKVAVIVRKKYHCPDLTILPGISKDLAFFLQEILNRCQGIRIHKSKKLPRKHYNSLDLLYLDPPLLLIDGSDQRTLEAVGDIVDKFLASHGVLEVVWEPIIISEPWWWLLMPRPKGMPGHLFAMFDNLQWKHPLVYHRYYSQESEMKNCSIFKKNELHCEPGCPGTKLQGIIASGYNADTGYIASKLRRALAVNIPFQAAPVRLGLRQHPPFWNRTIGWTFTYGACPSHFLDCFFLDHSPCPKIDIDVKNGPYHLMVDPSRLRYNMTVEDNPLWYKRAVGHYVDKPRYSIGGLLRGRPATHVAYTYLFRPKYFVRKEIQRRVAAFGLLPNSCAVMHVRRGDSGQSMCDSHMYCNDSQITIDCS